MPRWNSFSFAFGPVIGLLAIGVMVLILRWAFARGKSVVERPSQKGSPDEYGMLIPIAPPADYIQGEILRRTLTDSGIKATLATTTEGPRILIWPGDEQRAQSILSRGR